MGRKWDNSEKNHLQAELGLSYMRPELGWNPQQWDDEWFRELKISILTTQPRGAATYARKCISDGSDPIWSAMHFSEMALGLYGTLRIIICCPCVVCSCSCNLWFPHKNIGFMICLIRDSHACEIMQHMTTEVIPRPENLRGSIV